MVSVPRFNLFAMVDHDFDFSTVIFENADFHQTAVAREPG
jgi:hypothetical protein